MLDVLCIGHASFDQLFEVPRHPDADEKLSASSLTLSGGGPAANASVMVAKLGGLAGFSGYLGQDLQGAIHLDELRAAGVDVRGVIRGEAPTPMSVILAKPDGARTLVNYKGHTPAVSPELLEISCLTARVLLFDGHEPALSEAFLDRSVPKVLDGGSVHAGTLRLLDAVDHLVVSERFARQWLGRDDPQVALDRLAEKAPVVVVTLGSRGLIWRCQGESGALSAPVVSAVDSTGAGDAFHGAYAAGLAEGLVWPQLLRFATAAGALCCETAGARPGLPERSRVEALIARGWRETP